MEELRVLKEQLERCQSWLKEEPNDLEVQQKVEELQSQIDSIEKEAKLKARVTYLETELNRLHKVIASEQRTLRERPLQLSKDSIYYSYVEPLNAILAETKAAACKAMAKNIEEFNKLAEEYFTLVKVEE